MPGQSGGAKPKTFAMLDRAALLRGIPEGVVSGMQTAAENYRFRTAHKRKKGGLRHRQRNADDDDADERGVCCTIM